MNKKKEHHHHFEQKNSKKLIFVLLITAIYMVAEFLGGYFSKSLALTADAGHMLGDGGSLALSLFALLLTSKKATSQRTYGYYRAEILAAFINGCTLVFIAFAIIYEAYMRLKFAQNIDAISMSIIATGGLLVNIIAAVILHSGSKDNLNIKGAFFHVLGDLLGSIGAISAGIIIYFWQFYLADTIISVVIALLVLNSSFSLIQDAVSILMESAPKNIDIKQIKLNLSKIDGIFNIHDLHVWSINSANISLSVHVVANLENSERILKEINELLNNEFDIHHATIQIEPENFHENKCTLG